MDSTEEMDAAGNIFGMILHILFTIDTRYKIQDTRILFRYHTLTIEYNKIYIYTMSVKNKEQTKSK